MRSIRVGFARWWQPYSRPCPRRFLSPHLPKASSTASHDVSLTPSFRSVRRSLPAKQLGVMALLCILLVSEATAQTVDQQKLYSGTVDSQATSDDLAMLEFRIHAKNLLFHDRFAELDRIADSARTEKSRFVGGQWKLFVFYRMLASPGPLTGSVPDSGWDSYIARVKRWIAANPDSITARLVLADVYVLYAWKARGNDFGDKVTKEGRRLFTARIAQAKAVLDEAAKLSAKCPHYYETMQSVALAQEWSRARAIKLLEEAAAFEPSYYYYYLNHVKSLLPVWGGLPGEGVTFADWVADYLGGPQGDFVYFSIAARFGGIDLGIPSNNGIPVPTLSWDRVKRGFAAAEQLYGTPNNQLNLMAYLAVQVNDKREAQHLFGRIGEDYDQGVWGTKSAFDEAKAAVQRRPKKSEDLMGGEARDPSGLPEIRTTAPSGPRE